VSFNSEQSTLRAGWSPTLGLDASTAQRYPPTPLLPLCEQEGNVPLYIHDRIASYPAKLQSIYCCLLTPFTGPAHD
jgi:hypothetical protein